MAEPRGEASVKKRKLSSYQGYTLPYVSPGSSAPDRPPQTSTTTLDVVDATTVDAPSFFARYVAPRKPCILINVAMPSASAIVRVLLSAKTTLVQVEKRLSPSDRFGQPRSSERQSIMSVDDFARECCGCRLATSDDEVSAAPTSEEQTSSYYLSTQEEKPEDCAAAAAAPPPPFFGPPCNVLLEKGVIPSNLPLAGNLRLQSCNVWMGSWAVTQTDDATKTHSGLHHDYHDNFYLLAAGAKEFRLYAPSDAGCMAVAGEIDTVHFNGVISYAGNPIRADGVPLMATSNGFGHKLPKDAIDDDVVKCTDRLGMHDEADGDDDKEETVFGKGFDYQSSDDDEVYGALAAATGDDNFEDDGTANDESSGDVSVDDAHRLPNHFSWIDPLAASREKIAETFPAFAKGRECIVQLSAGQCLYLPASWFHCVSSSGSSADSTQAHGGSEATTHNKAAKHDVILPSSLHMAINYWYHPPDNLTDFALPYCDRDYWEKASKLKHPESLKC